ncbi:MAG TPA: ABC transporter permease [Acetobacteraceae bacterium]|nr:ABC transporter permease [Acetobacteraceae bacterium]
MRRFLARLGAFFRRGRAEREMAREMAAHLALMEDDFRWRGMTEEEARLAARRAWGGLAQSQELHRDARSFVWLEQWLQDLRHAGRGLRKSPGFVAVALLSLAFGIGANTAIFTLVNSILLKRLPVSEPERVVQVKARKSLFDTTVVSYPLFRELARQDEFSAAAAFNSAAGPVDFGAGEQQVEFAFVTAGYFPFFAGRPVLGRLLGDEDDRTGASPVCVISYSAWQAHFGGDPGVLGRVIRVKRKPMRVVGVVARGFTGAEMQRREEVWAPTAAYTGPEGVTRDEAALFWLRMLARLRPGVSMAQASAQITAASSSLPGNGGKRGLVFSVADGSRGNDRWRTRLASPLAILMGAVTLVLLVACANLANLLLARSGERRQEFAIKLSLGIGRRRLLRQLLIETAAVTFAGGALAWGIALGITRYLLTLFNSSDVYLPLHIAPDARVLLYTFAGCVAIALAAGLYPAWQSARVDIAQRLARPEGGRRGAVRRTLILVQVMLAVVLLFGASMFTHSLRKLKTVDLGYDIDHVLAVAVGDDSGRPAKVAPPEVTAILDRVRQLPAVESAALCSPGILTGGGFGGDLELKDGNGGKRTIEEVHRMFSGPGFIATMRMPLLRGRDFGPSDREGAPAVALVNQRLASLVWPGEDAIGKRLPTARGDEPEVVGLVANSKYSKVAEESGPILYLPLAQTAMPVAAVEIRGRRDLASVERDVRRLVKATAPGYSVRSATPLTLLRDTDLSQERVLAFLSSLFGAIGTALALVGIYGLISYAVTRRTREVGIRMSVGAQRGDVLWLFLRESVALMAAGIAIGLPLALGLASLAGKLLFGITTREPEDVAITLTVLVAGGVAAAYLPGRRATRVDPVQALRQD